MTDPMKPDLPAAVREATEQGLDQARKASRQFIDMVKKAQESMAQSTGAMAASAQDVQRRAVAFADQSVDAGLAFAAEIARAQSLQEIMDIQRRYAQRQMELCQQQAQELGAMMADAAQKIRPKP